MQGHWEVRERGDPREKKSRTKLVEGNARLGDVQVGDSLNPYYTVIPITHFGLNEIAWIRCR